MKRPCISAGPGMSPREPPPLPRRAPGGWRSGARGGEGGRGSGAALRGSAGDGDAPTARTGRRVVKARRKKTRRDEPFSRMPNMAIEGRLTKKKMIDRTIYLNSPAEPLVTAAGTAPSARPCLAAAAGSKGGPGRACCRSSELSWTKLSRVQPSPAQPSLSRGERGAGTMEAEGVGRHRAYRFRPQSPSPEGSVLTIPLKKPTLSRCLPREARVTVVTFRRIPVTGVSHRSDFAGGALAMRSPPPPRGWGCLPGTCRGDQHPDPTICSAPLTAETG